MRVQNLFSDAYQPSQIAERVSNMGVAKAKADTITLIVLAVLAGAFISLGGLFYAFVISGVGEAWIGIARLIGGLSFCLGLILVVVGGAELFTGNNLLAMAWASRLITTKDVMRNWTIVYTGNVAGCLGTVLLVYWADAVMIDNGLVEDTLVKIAQSKSTLTVLQALSRGILCNTLVCLAVWLAMGGRSVTDKILAILFPIAGFVTMGFEHSIANWFFLPMGMVLSPYGTDFLEGAVINLIFVSLGNIIGGTILVAGVYWLAYLRNTSLQSIK